MFALIDCNNFFASCERVFDPTLRDRPVAILSNNDGCVIARSNEVKPFVPMGAVAHKYADVFRSHNISVLSSNYTLYGDFSNRVMRILSEYTPDIEIYSIDEAFLRFDGFEEYDLYDYGVSIKNDVFQRVKIPISIGIAPTKALSKIANKIAKKFPVKTNGVYLIDSDLKRDKALKWIKIDDVWGIGRRLSKRLYRYNINTAYDFIQLTDAFIKKEFSVVELRLKKELQGTPTLQLNEAQNKKSIATTRSFKKQLNDFDMIKERVVSYACRCAEKLRKQQSLCNMIHVFIRTNPFKKEAQYNNSIVINLPYPTSSSITIAKYATIGLQAIYKEGYSYKKTGVIVMGINPNTNKQLKIFGNENPRHDALMSTMDKINRRYDHRMIKLASQKSGQQFTERLYVSKRYTTSWHELLEVQ